MKRFKLTGLLVPLALISLLGLVDAGEIHRNPELDGRVEAFLDSHRSSWHDMNVPMSDGKLLHDIIVKHNYRRALEIGTSTGRSAIWIAWALSKTGGKLITIEIDERRYKEALNNFEEAGLSQYIDARLADAHDLVKALDGPFDFVFIDADKNWYTNYFKDIAPKLDIGGCFTAHNMSMAGWSRGVREFIDYVLSRPDFQTTIDNTSRAGVSISYKAYEMIPE
jgi:predicted O-methyltransferase YrrM